MADWVAQCKWPKGVTGNWQSLEQLPGTLRLCSKSLFFEPEDVRIPIVRSPSLLPSLLLLSSGLLLSSAQLGKSASRNLPGSHR